MSVLVSRDGGTGDKVSSQIIVFPSKEGGATKLEMALLQPALPSPSLVFRLDF